MLKRCNYYIILIIFIVNTSEFAYFFFQFGTVTKGGSDCCLCSSHRVALALSTELFVTNCGGERLQCNHLPGIPLLGNLSLDWEFQQRLGKNLGN